MTPTMSRLAIGLGAALLLCGSVLACRAYAQMQAEARANTQRLIDSSDRTIQQLDGATKTQKAPGH